MKNTIILFIILFIFSIFVKLPEYKELNNLKIIDKIIVYCSKTKYREIIPIKDDGEIEYKYIYHNNIDKDKYYTSKAKIINKCKK